MRTKKDEERFVQSKNTEQSLPPDYYDGYYDLIKELRDIQEEKTCIIDGEMALIDKDGVKCLYYNPSGAEKRYYELLKREKIIISILRKARDV